MIEPYYQDEHVTIYLGDCREILPTLPRCDLVLTDPPYPGFSQVLYTPMPSDIEAMDCRQFIFWPAKLTFPFEFSARHVWHKPNGCSSEHYEFIYERNGGGVCRVFRMAAILPRYTQFQHECVDHPTQKPLKLVHAILGLDRNSSLVLDPFMGSGTTLRAAKDLGRKAIGIEINEAYCQIAVQRMRQKVLEFRE